jgi:hypothetical protein
VRGSAQILTIWIEMEGCKQSWVAQQAGCSPRWLNYILKGKRPMSDTLARTLRNKLGIPLFDEKQAIRNGHKKKTSLKAKNRVGHEPVQGASR